MVTVFDDLVTIPHSSVPVLCYVEFNFNLKLNNQNIAPKTRY